MSTLPPKQPFSKVPVKTETLLEHWKQQGLIINDEARALHYLKFIGHYRLRGYGWFFRDHTSGPTWHCFQAGTTFDKVLEVYKFDRKLRTLVMDALERIEVAVRSVISDIASVSKGAHWFMDRSNFHAKFDVTLLKIRETLDSRSSTSHNFLEHYYSKYSRPELPPSWMLFELLSFGTVSVIYSNVSTNIRRDVAREFGLKADNMESWIRALSYLRNLCAHHSRIWNRAMTLRPKIDYLREYEITASDRFYALASIIHYFLVKIKGASKWASGLSELLGQYSIIDSEKMGFPRRWQELAPWRPPSSASGGL